MLGLLACYSLATLSSISKGRLGASCSQIPRFEWLGNSLCSIASQTKKGLKMSFSLSPKGPLLCFSSDFRSCWFVFLLSAKVSGNWKPCWGCSPASVHQSEIKAPFLDAKDEGMKEAGTGLGSFLLCIQGTIWYPYSLLKIHSEVVTGWLSTWLVWVSPTHWQAWQGGYSCPYVTYRK